MQTIGIVLILCGAFLIYETLHSRLRSGSSSSASSSGGGGSGGSSSGGGGGGGASADSGQHQGLDASGNVYTIDSTYGNMSDTQQDDANRYAHQIGNVG